MSHQPPYGEEQNEDQIYEQLMDEEIERTNLIEEMSGTGSNEQDSDEEEQVYEDSRMDEEEIDNKNIEIELDETFDEENIETIEQSIELVTGIEVDLSKQQLVTYTRIGDHEMLEIVKEDAKEESKEEVEISETKSEKVTIAIDNDDELNRVENEMLENQEIRTGPSIIEQMMPEDHEFSSSNSISSTSSDYTNESSDNSSEFSTSEISIEEYSSPFFVKASDVMKRFRKDKRIVKTKRSKFLKPSKDDDDSSEEDINESTFTEQEQRELYNKTIMKLKTKELLERINDMKEKFVKFYDITAEYDDLIIERSVQEVLSGTYDRKWNSSTQTIKKALARLIGKEVDNQIKNFYEYLSDHKERGNIKMDDEDFSRLIKMIKIYYNIKLIETPKRAKKMIIAICNFITDNVINELPMIEEINRIREPFRRSLRRNLQNLIEINSDIIMKQVDVITTNEHGIIKRQNAEIMVLTNNNVTATAFKFQVGETNLKILEEKPPPWIDFILQKTKTVVFDHSNMIRSMNLKLTDLEAISYYLSQWGINVIDIIESPNDIIKKVSINLLLDDYQHDDIMVQFISMIGECFIITNDQHKEFKDTFTMCIKHNCLLARKNEDCPYADKSDCIIKQINSYSVGKISIIDAVTIDEKQLTSIKIKVDLTQQNIQHVYTKYTKCECPKPYDKMTFNEIDWAIVDRSLSIPLHVKTIQTMIASHTFACIALSSLSSVNMYVTNSIPIAVLTAIVECDQTYRQNLIASIEDVLDLNDYRFYIKRGHDKISARQQVDPMSISTGGKNLFTVISRMFKYTFSSDKTCNVYQYLRDVKLNKGFVDLNKAVLIIHNNLMDESIACLSDGVTNLLIKLSPTISTLIQKSILNYINDNVISDTTMMFQLPMTILTRQNIESIFMSEDSPHEDYYYDVAATRPQSNQLVRYLARMQPDKPSKAIIADPDKGKWTNSIINLEFKISYEISNKIEFVLTKEKDEILDFCTASMLYKQWEQIQGDKPTINISSVDWNSRGINVRGLSENELAMLLKVIPDKIDEMINAVQQDVLTTMANLYNGFEGVTLTSIIRGSTMRKLKICEEYKDSYIPIQVELRLPTCFVIVRMIINKERNKNYIVGLVSVSPPIVLNAIAAKLNLPVTITNEYNEILCNRVEEESMELFEYLYEKMDYLPIYISYYGIFSEGLKLLQKDPLQVILRNAKVIESGCIGAEIITIPRTMKMRLPIQNLIDYSEAVIKGTTMGILVRKIIGGNYNISLETHIIIERIFKNIALIEDKMLSFYLTHMAYIVGTESIIRHLRICYGMSMQEYSSVEKLRKFFEKQKKKDFKGCQISESIDVPLHHKDKYFIRGNTISTLCDMGQQMMITKEGVVPNLKINRYMQTHNIINGIPALGEITSVVITNKNRQLNKFTRQNNVKQVLEGQVGVRFNEFRWAYDEKQKTGKVDIIDFLINKFNGIKNEHNTIVIIAFDSFGPLIKKSLKYDKGIIKLNKGQKIYIPDDLLYNVLRDVFIVPDTEFLMATEDSQTGPKEKPAVISQLPKLSEDNMKVTLFFGTAIVVLFAMYFALPMTKSFLLWPGRLVMSYSPKWWHYNGVMKVLGFKHTFIKPVLFKLMSWSCNLMWWVMLGGTAYGATKLKEN